MRLRAVLLVVGFVVGSSACSGAGSDSVELQALRQERDRLAEQVQALQEELDALRQEPADTVETSAPETTAPDTTGAPVDTSAATGEVVPAAPDASTLVKAFGNVGALTIPAGESGKVSVVLMGSALDRSSSLPVIVRNNTSEVLGSIEVTGIARDSAGNLAGSGSSQGFKPALVNPGEIAFGYVFFGDVVGDQLVFELSATGEAPNSFFNSIPIQITELTVSGDQIIGLVTNTSDKSVSGPISVDGVCFSESGTLIGDVSGYAEQDELAPGAQGSFSIDLFGEPCPIGLLSSSGWDF